MNLRDRISSLRTGGFPDTPSGVPSRDDELAELRDLVIRLTHDLDATRADRAEMYLRLVRSRNHVADLQGRLLAAEVEIASYYEVVE